jgi:hypothetical protein
MVNFKNSAVAWFKDKRYWESVFVGAVTTLFGEWVAIAVSSALVNKGVIQPGRASETLQGIIHILFGWAHYIISKQLGQEELGILFSAINIVLGICKLAKALIRTNPYTYIKQKIPLVEGLGMAAARAFTPS